MKHPTTRTSSRPVSPARSGRASRPDLSPGAVGGYGPLAAAALLALSGAPAFSAQFITPASVAYDIPSGNPATRLIDGSGLSGGDPYVGVTHSAGEDETNWKIGTDVAYTNPHTFDLGGTYDLDHIEIWNYSHGGFDFYKERDARDVAISTSTDGVTFTPFTTITLAQHGLVPEPMQEFELAATASHVRLQITSNYGGGEVGLGEVRFHGAAAVPEPAEYAAAFGLALAGFAVWRRRSRAA